VPLIQIKYDLYIIENTKGRLYIGVSQEVRKRVISHNRPEGPDWTQGKGPWKLIYTEEYSDQSSALKRERFLKSLKAGQRLKQILEIPE